MLSYILSDGAHVAQRQPIIVEELQHLYPVDVDLPKPIDESFAEINVDHMTPFDRPVFVALGSQAMDGKGNSI